MPLPGEADGAPEPWLGGRLRLRQAPRGAHRAGTDAALLAALLTAGDGETLLDLGAGTGSVGLAAALYAPGCRVVLVERDPELAALARESAVLNGFSERVCVVVADVLASASERLKAGLVTEMAEVVLTNPPFFETGRQRPSPVLGKADAHHYAEGGLERWLRTCASVLKVGGRLGIIHRADTLPACLDALRPRFGSVAVRPVHSRANSPAIRVLVTATKGSRGPFSLLRPLVLHDATGRFTQEADALHRGRTA